MDLWEGFLKWFAIIAGAEIVIATVALLYLTGVL